MNHNQDQVLRLKLYQETACYKKPTAFKVGETYPLPPYSTVKGMLHHLIDATELIPLKICIQGSYESRIVDYQSHFQYKRKKNISEVPLVMSGLALQPEVKEITSRPLYVHMLLDVHLVIHVAAEESVLQQIEQAVLSGKAISLGRWEDLVRIDACERVNVQLRQDDETLIPLPVYWPKSKPINVSGVPYRLNWIYDIVDGIRQWKKIKVEYIQERTLIWDDIYWDEAGYPVVFPSEMEGF